MARLYRGIPLVVGGAFVAAALLGASPAFAQAPLGTWSDTLPQCEEAYTITKDKVLFRNKPLMVEDDCAIKGFSVIQKHKYSIKTECADQSGNSDEGMSSTFVVTVIDDDTISMSNVDRELRNKRLKRCGPLKTSEMPKQAVATGVPPAKANTSPWHPSLLFGSEEVRRAAIQQFMGPLARFENKDGGYAFVREIGKNVVAFWTNGKKHILVVEFVKNDPSADEILSVPWNNMHLFGFKREDIISCNEYVMPVVKYIDGIRVTCQINKSKFLTPIQAFSIWFERAN